MRFVKDFSIDVVLFYYIKKCFFLNVCCVLVFYVFCVVMCVGFCADHFVMVPLKLTYWYLYCLQHSFFEISSIYMIRSS